jgi:hypothetical protein
MREKGGKPFFKLLLYENDEKSRVFSDRFWEEWKRDAGYADGDSLDYAFISDETDFKLDVPPDYPVCAPTCFFNYAGVRAFMEKNLHYDNLSLSYLGKTDRIKNVVSNNGKCFFLTIPEPSEKNTKSHSSFKDDSPLGAYFDDKKQEWKDKR